MGKTLNKTKKKENKIFHLMLGQGLLTRQTAETVPT
jgi:hypothetical protein